MGMSISIHAPLAGCDLVQSGKISQQQLFQSTHPLRGATSIITVGEKNGKFQSTHPLRGATRTDWRDFFDL